MADRRRMKFSGLHSFAPSRPPAAVNSTNCPRGITLCRCCCCDSGEMLRFLWAISLVCHRTIMTAKNKHDRQKRARAQCKDELRRCEICHTVDIFITFKNAPSPVRNNQVKMNSAYLLTSCIKRPRYITLIYRSTRSVVSIDELTGYIAATRDFHHVKYKVCCCEKEDASPSYASFQWIILRQSCYAVNVVVLSCSVSDQLTACAHKTAFTRSTCWKQVVKVNLLKRLNFNMLNVASNLLPE